jgi:hypothetical protein
MKGTQSGHKGHGSYTPRPSAVKGHQVSAESPASDGVLTSPLKSNSIDGVSELEVNKNPSYNRGGIESGAIKSTIDVHSTP